jgi:autotransporter passenger strand-loop-strand repeat protein
MNSGNHYLEGASASGYSYSTGNEQHIRSGGTADATVLDGGAQYVSNGTALDTVVSSGGSQIVYDGGTANSTNISSGGRQDVQSNGSASNTVLNGGIEHISSGGTATGTTVDSGGEIHQYAGGVISNLTMNSGKHYLEGASASGYSYSTGNEQHIRSGGTADATVLDGGAQYVSNGTALDTVVSGGGSVAVFAGGVAFNARVEDGTLTASAANVLSGAFSLGANGVMDIQTNSQTITELFGDGATSIGAGGLLTLNQAASATYDGQFIGSGGSFAKMGTGTITLTHSANALNRMDVSAGGVMLGLSGGNAALTGSAVVHDGGWLGGYGTLTGNASVQSGGSFVAGGAYNSALMGGYGGMTISGNLDIDAGGVYQTRVDSGSTSADTVTVTGTATVSGAIFSHVAPSVANGEDYATGSWLVMSAGGVAGEFDAATRSTLAFWKPVLDYTTPNAIYVGFARSADFADYGDTHNRAGVASGLASLDPSSGLVVDALNLNADQIPVLFDQLSGDMHASLTGGLMLLDRDFSLFLLARSGRNSLARTILAASVPAFRAAEGYASIHPRALDSRFANNFWVDAGYARQGVDGDGNAGRYTLKGPEVSLGYDHIAPSGWLSGVAFRYVDRDMEVNSRLADADIDSYSLAAYGGFQTLFGPGAARLVVGGVYTRHEVDGHRRVNVGAINQRLESDYHANSYQLFMEGAYALPVGAVWLEPFVDLAWTSMRVPGFTEKGGNAALRSRSHSRNNLSQLLGLRLVLPTNCRVNIEAQAGWRHTYGTLDKAQAFSFAEGGSRFGIKGSKLNRDEAVLDLRADYRVRDNLRLGLEGNAAVGERGTSVRGGAFVALEW